MFLRDDAGVSPVVGYILTFAVTSAFLIVVLTTSTQTLNRRHEEAAELQLTDLTHRMANAIEEAIYVIDANPDANYTKRLPLPENVRGFEYKVEVNVTNVWVNTTNGVLRTHTIIHNPNEHPLEGSIQRRLSARITYDPGTGVTTLEGGD